MRFEGSVKSWNDERGFGFIEPLQGGQEIFLPITAFPPGTDCFSSGPSFSWWTDFMTLNLSCAGLSGLVRLVHPCGNVALAVQDTPHVDVVFHLDAEDEVRVAREGPEAQARQVQLVRIAG
jgi:hypothetical protein